MIGGVVSIVTEFPVGVEINCVGTGSERYDRCAVRIAKDNRTWRDIRPGDSFWWLGREAYWVSRDSGRCAVFRRLGYSYKPGAC